MQVSGAPQTSRTAFQPMQSGLSTGQINPALTGGLMGGLAAKNLTPVQQGELARAQQVQARGEGFVDDIVDALRKFIEDLIGSLGKQSGKPEKPGETQGPSATGSVVEGAKTIDDFNLKGASKQDREDFKAMLEYLQRADANGKPVSPTAVELLAKLPKGQVVNINNQHDDHFNPRTGEIAWDPRSALKVTGTDKLQSPALGFIHEVDHAVNGLANPKPTGDGYDNTEEKRVITGSETTIAKDLGEPVRTDHYGSVEHVGGPNEHS